MSLIRKHVAVLQAWACLALVFSLCARLNWQLACHFSSANHLSYRIVSPSELTHWHPQCIANHLVHARVHIVTFKFETLCSSLQ